MTECKCDGCGWEGPQDDVNEIDLNIWAQYSDYDEMTALPVGECECGAPVYTKAAGEAWDLEKAAPLLLKELENLAITYAHNRKTHEPDFVPLINSNSLQRISGLMARLGKELKL